MSGTLEGEVVAAFGRHLLVRTAEGESQRARPFGRDVAAVCGDQVRCRRDPHHDELHVVAVLPRRSAIWRTDRRGRAEPVVANITQLLVVLAPLPVPDLFVVDRYLAAADAAGVAAALVVNKSDLPIDAALAGELAAYTSAGFTVVRCSATSGEGLAALRAQLAPHPLTALVGQSGVGKSSLVRMLVPHAEVAIGALARDEGGRHTTTAARRFDLPQGEALIDLPGVRDFAPAIETLDARTLGFVEVARLAPACRFADCRHLREPGCAVSAAAAAGALHPRRYESYRRLRRLSEPQRHGGGRQGG